MNKTVYKTLKELELFGRYNIGYFNVPEETGKFLNILARLSKSKSILEVGTSNGYSTIWLAEAVKYNKGKITTIEIDKEKVNQAVSNFKKTGLYNTIRIINGNALKEIPKLKGKFDFLFLDAVKTDYINYFRLAYPSLIKGTIIAADNAIIFADKMEDYLEFVRNNKNFNSVLLNIGTGLEVSYKLN